MSAILRTCKTCKWYIPPSACGAREWRDYVKGITHSADCYDHNSGGMCGLHAELTAVTLETAPTRMQRIRDWVSSR